MAINKFRQVAVLAALKTIQENLNSGDFFDVCNVTKLLECLGLDRDSKENLIHIHCVHYSDMPGGFKKDIIEELDRIIGDALAEVGIYASAGQTDYGLDSEMLIEIRGSE
jgi:hypothetical protein